jgi:predicted ATP-dependent Lon-type protease
VLATRALDAEAAASAARRLPPLRALCSAAAEAAAASQVVLRVAMMCNGCVGAVNRVLSKMEGA